MKCDSRVEKSCLSFEEFLDCPFSGKYFVCCAEAKHLTSESYASQFDGRIVYLRVKILLYLADIFRSLTMNEDIAELVSEERSHLGKNKIKQPRHIYQKISATSKTKISQKE